MTAATSSTTIAAAPINGGLRAGRLERMNGQLCTAVTTPPAESPSLCAMSLLSELTTLRLGGPAARMIEAHSEDGVVAAVAAADAAGDQLLVLAGGSNVVIADDGFPGTVVRILTSGVERHDETLTAQAGEPWDPLVERCVGEGLAGIECLSGIPGSVGATPIQNVGAYGQEVSETIVSVRAYDRSVGSIDRLAPEDCEFTYRSSVFKRVPGRWVVLAVTYELDRQDLSRPIRYPELARGLRGAVGA